MERNIEMKALQDNRIAYLQITTKIVSAYVSNNPVPSAELSKLISATHSTLTTLSLCEAESAAPASPRKPMVPINKSVHHDYLVCLEDGKQFRSLKRHLCTSHGMTPEDYRSKWGLPLTYPMTASSYSERRSALAKGFGLGRNRSAQPKPATALAKRGPKPRKP